MKKLPQTTKFWTDTSGMGWGVHWASILAAGQQCRTERRRRRDSSARSSKDNGCKHSNAQ
ncbi:hypothetical protein J6590_053515 [Homalodisca vitripennis]|nr:hypothetical protein J6590_053515 [Homalodisca vitripennis]